MCNTTDDPHRSGASFSSSTPISDRTYRMHPGAPTTPQDQYGYDPQWNGGPQESNVPINTDASNQVPDWAAKYIQSGELPPDVVDQMTRDYESVCKMQFFLSADLNPKVGKETLAVDVARANFQNLPNVSFELIEKARDHLWTKGRFYKGNFRASMFAAFSLHVAQCAEAKIDLLTMDRASRQEFCRQNFMCVPLRDLFPFARNTIDVESIRDCLDPCKDLAKSALLKDFLLNVYVAMFEKICFHYMKIDQSLANPRRVKDNKAAVKAVKEFMSSMCAAERYESLQISDLPRMPQAKKKKRPKNSAIPPCPTELDSQFNFLTADEPGGARNERSQIPQPLNGPPEELPDTCDETAGMDLVQGAEFSMPNQGHMSPVLLPVMQPPPSSPASPTLPPSFDQLPSVNTSANLGLDLNQSDTQLTDEDLTVHHPPAVSSSRPAKKSKKKR